MPHSLPAAVADADEALLRDALDEAGSVRRFSREPLGEGSVTGFEIAAPEPYVAYVDTSRLPVRIETGAALTDESGAVEARVWLHPADPYLPALAPAAFGHAAAALLDRAGIVATEVPAVTAYRPGRRAVLHVETETGRVWIKVVRPSRVERIVGIHALLADRGIPVPAVRVWSPEGLVVLDDAAGVPGLEADVAADDVIAAVDEMRERLARVPLAHPARASLADRVDWYASRFAEAGSAARAAALAARLRETAAREPARAAVGVHGDLHLGQLFLTDADTVEVATIIDLDTAGAGDAVEDAGAFIGHAVSSASLSRGMPGAARVQRLADAATARWAGDRAVRTRVAIQLLGHAVGADAAGDAPRTHELLALAEEFAGGSEAKNALTPSFGRA